MKEIVCRLVNYIRISIFNSKIPKIIITQELPEEVDGEKIYISKQDNEYCYLLMKCPCGCNNDIDLSLIKALKPKWEIKFNINGTISISPSIWRKVKCKSHFFYKKGNVYWCKS